MFSYFEPYAEYWHLLNVFETQLFNQCSCVIPDIENTYHMVMQGISHIVTNYPTKETETWQEFFIVTKHEKEMISWQKKITPEMENSGQNTPQNQVLFILLTLWLIFPTYAQAPKPTHFGAESSLTSNSAPTIRPSTHPSAEKEMSAANFNSAGRWNDCSWPSWSGAQVYTFD